MVKHVTWMVLLALLVVPAAVAADLAEVVTQGRLRVLYVPAVPSFFADDPGLPPGFDREILAGFCQLKRIALVPVAIPTWDKVVPSLLEGRGDVIAGVFTATESRRKTIDFTSEAFPTRSVVMTRKPHPPVLTLEQLQGRPVGCGKGSSMYELLLSLGIAPTIVDDSLDALRGGKVTAVIVGIEHAILAQRQDASLEIGLFVGQPESLAYGVRKEDAALQQALDDYLQNIRRSGTWNRLVVKYFGPTAPDVLRRARNR